MKDLKKFMSQFKFDKNKGFFIGAERECHLLDLKGNIVPIAPKVLKNLISRNGQFSYELSACQLEWRIGPCENIFGFTRQLENFEIFLRHAEKEVKFRRSFEEVAPEDMPLDIYPDPTGRYQEITKNMPRNILSAACQVIATHIHIGMPDAETALRSYNKAINSLDYFCKIGDHSSGRRLKIYSIMAPDFMPYPYKDWQEFFEKAKKEKFIDDPRKCWTLIRISKHGTIEFRMFGATNNLEEIVHWANLCQKACQ
jgi:gamma-glutamyl:cysteine ligase YbdK (ATP-grasp superfamily)